jgi:hypothetical protein
MQAVVVVGLMVKPVLLEAVMVVLGEPAVEVAVVLG